MFAGYASYSVGNLLTCIETVLFELLQSLLGIVLTTKLNYGVVEQMIGFLNEKLLPLFSDK